MKKRLEALWCALFRVNKNATGYTWPICRILLCLLSYWLLTVVNGSRPMSTPRAVVFVLLIVVIVLGAKLGAAQKAAKGAETQIEELQEQVKKLEEEKKAAEDAANEPDEKLPGEDTPAVDPNKTKEPDTSVSDSKRKVGWLDLTGHSEVTVLPKKVFNEYASYYTTAGVNLRSGPSTSYGKVQLVDRGTKVKAAAKEGNWTFVSVGSKFGWISSDYLSTKPPVEVTSGSLSRT